MRLMFNTVANKYFNIPWKGNFMTNTDMYVSVFYSKSANIFNLIVFFYMFSAQVDFSFCGFLPDFHGDLSVNDAGKRSNER